MAIKYSSIGGGTGTGFNVQINSKYSYATFTQAQPAGSYTIKSAGNFTNWDVYVLDASNNLVAYTGGAALNATSAFSAIVVLNGTVSDILQFSFQSTVSATATTDKTKAGPFITAFGSSVIPNQNSAVTITGGNFAPGILATFTGTDSVVRTCKSVVYTSTTSISVVRPDVLPIGFAPYTLTLTNPSVDNPTNSNVNKLTGLTVGAAPTWTTGTSLSAASANTPYSVTVVATDPDAGGSISYSFVSGALPTGLSFNASTGVISGTYSGFADGTASYTIRATDSGGNYTDRTFTIGFTGISGGTLTSDATYYYRAFTGNNTLVVPANLSVDLVMVAGGGGGGWDVGAGGGAGGMIVKTGYTIPSGNHTVTIGSGGPAATNGSSVATTRNGGNTTLGSILTALGGGGSGTYANMLAADGGSGGGGIGSSGYTTGGAALQPSSASGGLGYPGGTGVAANGANNYSGYAGGGGAGGKGGDGINPWSTSGDTVYGCGGVGVQVSWITTYGDPDYRGWFAGGGGASTDTPDGASNKGWGVGGKGGGGDGTNRIIAQGTGTGGYYYIDGKPNTGGGGGGGGNISGASYPASNGNTGGPGGSGFMMIRYTRASVGG